MLALSSRDTAGRLSIGHVKCYIFLSNPWPSRTIRATIVYKAGASTGGLGNGDALRDSQSRRRHVRAPCCRYQKKRVHIPSPTSLKKGIQLINIAQKGYIAHPHRQKRVYTPTRIDQKGYTGNYLHRVS